MTEQDKNETAVDDESGKQEKQQDDTDETLTNVSDLNSEDNPKSKSKSMKAEKEQKRRLFFQEELKRLQKGLQKESSKIKAPPVKEHVPYCFNSLEPYYNTATATHVIVKTDDTGKLKDATPEYATRQTAIGLVDPWVNHHMDIELAPKVKVKEPTAFRTSPRKEKKVGEGSTMIPVFPTVNLDTPDIESRKLDYNDVPMLRKELKEKYSSQGKVKIDQDYERTKVDFYRMELHRLNDVHPINRDNMKAAYFAYLQNTPGSKKAVKECVKQVATSQDKEEEEDSKEDETAEKPSSEEEKEKEETTEKQETTEETQEPPAAEQTEA